MDNEKNKELFSLRPVLNTTPKGFVDLSTVKESGASKIYKTKSAAKAQATRKKNKAKASKLTREEILWKDQMYMELYMYIKDLEIIICSKMREFKAKKIEVSNELAELSDDELKKRIESLVKILNSK